VRDLLRGLRCGKNLFDHEAPMDQPFLLLSKVLGNEVQLSSKRARPLCAIWTPKAIPSWLLNNSVSISIFPFLLPNFAM
jgi:hypothetical protein